MADIQVTVHWPAVPEATVYRLTRLHPDGSETLVVETTETFHTLLVPETDGVVLLVRPVIGGQLGPAQQLVVERPLTLEMVRNRVRLQLRDTVSQRHRWSDEELDTYLREAIADYSRYFPQEREMVLSSPPSSFSLPPDLLSIRRVLYRSPNGQEWVLPERDGQGGIWHGLPRLGILGAVGGGYRREGDRLRLLFEPETGSQVVIRYTAPYPIPLYPKARVEVPGSDVELLELYAMGKATARVENQDAQLSRWNETSSRDQNPLVVVVNRYFQAYQERIRSRLGLPRTRRLTRVRRVW